MIRRILILLVALFPLLSQAKQVEVPPFSAPVVDLTNTLSASQIKLLEEKISTVSRFAQIAVLMLPTIGDEPIENFAQRVFEKWKPGKSKENNGLVVIVVKQDQQARIEVGYGLEGTVTDVSAGRILRGTLFPALRQNDFFGGISGTIGAINTFIENGELPQAPENVKMISDKMFDTLFGSIFGSVFSVFLFVLLPFRIKQRYTLRNPKTSADTKKTQARLRGLWLRVLLSVIATNLFVCFVIQQSALLSYIFSFSFLLVTIGSFFVSFIATLFIVAAPASMMQGGGMTSRGRFPSSNNPLGGGGFRGGSGGFRGGGGGRSGGGGASGRW